MIHRYARTTRRRVPPIRPLRGDRSRRIIGGSLCAQRICPMMSSDSFRSYQLAPSDVREGMRACTRTHGHLFPRNPVHPTTSHERRERRRGVLSPSYPSGASPLLISSASCSTALVPTKDPTLQYVFIQGIRRQKRVSSGDRERADGREHEKSPRGRRKGKSSRNALRNLRRG